MLVMTIDGRRFKQKSPTKADLNGVACPKMSSCFAVGAKGTIVARQ